MWKYFLRWLDIKTCKHDWETYHKSHIYNINIIGQKSENPSNIKHTMLCKECGIFKKITV